MNNDDEDEFDDAELFMDALTGAPYEPPGKGPSRFVPSRDENYVVYLEIACAGGRKLRDGSITQPRNLGKLYFELRNDLVPLASTNFATLCSGYNGYGEDGVRYHYKGIRIHRIVKDLFFQSGDLLDRQGECSRSTHNKGGLFRDENFILRHAGAGVVSYCNRGPDTNGSLFQVSFRENPDMDEKYVVFGCLAANESYECLNKINALGTVSGTPLEEVRIIDCDIAYPKQTS